MRPFQRDTPVKDRGLRCWRIAIFTTHRIGALSGAYWDYPVTLRDRKTQSIPRHRADLPIVPIREPTQSSETTAKLHMTPNGPVPQRRTQPSMWLLARMELRHLEA